MGKSVVEACVKLSEALLKQARKINRPAFMHAHNDMFMEVKVAPDLLTVHVTRMVNTVAAGYIINLKTGRSQVLGSVIWGIGSALMEESVMDHRFGRYMNYHYAKHHIFMNTDTHDIDVIFMREEDDKVNPLGITGLDEVGPLGIAPYLMPSTTPLTSARDLPITIDKLL